MALICILIGIIFDRSSDILENRRNLDWFDQYSRWMLKNMPGLNSQGYSSIVILLLPVMLLVGIIQNWIGGNSYAVIELIFALSIFAFCLGPRDLSRQINRYLDARKNGNEAAAINEASAIMLSDAPEAPDQQTIEVLRGVLHAANDRFFAVIFWFVLLGPFGALLYRLSSHTRYSSDNANLIKAARQLQAIMAWAPAHLVAIGYALTGNYEGAKQEFYNKNKQEDLADCNYHTLITAGQGALKDCTPGDESACIHSAQSLVLRTLIAWLAVIGALTLMGWMS